MVRSISDTQCRLGLLECTQNDLLLGSPVRGGRRSDFIAVFKYTAIIGVDETTRMTGNNLPLPFVHSEYQLPAPLSASVTANE